MVSKAIEGKTILYSNRHFKFLGKLVFQDVQLTNADAAPVRNGVDFSSYLAQTLYRAAQLAGNILLQADLDEMPRACLFLNAAAKEAVSTAVVDAAQPHELLPI